MTASAVAAGQQAADAATRTAELLDAIEIFTPLGLAALVARLEVILCEIDDRLGRLEYRLDSGGAGSLPNGIPDALAAGYFTLSALRGAL